MTKLAVFQKEASVGAHVTLRLTRGEDVSGRIEHLDDTCVRLDLGERTITVFEEILAGWEVHRIGEPGRHSPVAEPLDEKSTDDEHLPIVSAASPGDARAETAGTEVPSEYQGNRPIPLDEPDPTTDLKVLSELARVKATFSEAVKRARLELPEPDFQFPEAEFPQDAVEEVRREWNRAKNQYEYAQKINEPSRLNSVVAQVLVPLVDLYPNSAPARSLLGRMLLKLNRPAEAKDHLAAAATLSDIPAHWLALASAAGAPTAVECYALRRHFSLTPPQRENDAWFRYLASAIKHYDLRGAVQVIQSASEQKKEDPDVNRLLSESVIYLLSSSGSETLALRASASLVYGSGELPPGWENEFDSSSTPLSQELLDVEREFTRPSGRILPTPSPQPLRPKEGSPVPHGRITSFGNQGSGFIQAHSEEMFFFRIDNVADGELERALRDGNWRTFGEVEFDIQPSQGHRYQRASNIIRLRDSEALLQDARKFLRANQHSQSMALVRRVLGTDPTNETARQLREDIRKRGVGLPRDNGPFAQAKRAQLIDQDFEAAEKLLRQAIDCNDRLESAVKDLASLLQQQGRAEDAIALLESNSDRNKDGSYDNMLATQYQHANRHDDAIRILKRLIERATKPSQASPLLKRMAFSYFKCAKYKDAERVLGELLSKNPNDQTAARWLASLEDARSAGNYAEAEEIIGDLGGLTEEGMGLSSLARTAIDHCTYEGVDAEKIQAGTTSNRDVIQVEELARRFGRRRPRDRAAYYLSAAALLERNPGDSGPRRIYADLRRYFASMADASWIEGKPADVVRSYYIESLALVLDDHLAEAWRSLLRYIGTFSSPEKLRNIEKTIPPERNYSIPTYTTVIQEAMATIEPGVRTACLEGLLVIGSQSSFARDHLYKAIRTSSSLEATFANLLGSTNQGGTGIQGTWHSRCREQARTHQRRLSVCRTLTKYAATVAAMEELGKQLGNALEETTSELDRRRLDALRDIADSALAFCRASDFEEKERNYWLVTTQVDRFREEVVDAPTQYSHEGLLPVADHLKSLIEEEYAQIARTSGAELNLQLIVDQYLPGPEGELRLQIEVSNKRGCSPASSVRICLGPEDSEYFAAEHLEREVITSLRGGDTIVTQMEIHPKAAAGKDRAFPIDAMAIYRDHLGEENALSAKHGRCVSIGMKSFSTLRMSTHLMPGAARWTTSRCSLDGMRYWLVLRTHYFPVLEASQSSYSDRSGPANHP